MMLEFYQDKKEEWRWRVQAENGQIIAASSEGYVELRDAKANVTRLMKALFDQCLALVESTTW